MNINAITNSVTRKFSRAGFKFKKYSPEILIVAGVAGVVTSTVMACKASTKIGEVMDDAKAQIDHIHETIERVNDGEEVKCQDGSDYSAEDGKKDLTIVYTQTAVKFAKMYGPAVILGIASISGILASNNILRKRNVALAAAYATIDKGFKEYRGRVVDRFGKELDKELRYNIKAQEVEEVTVDDKGKEHSKKSTVNAIDGSLGYSDYARIFDEYCTGWSKDPEMNLMFLRRQQDYANERLKGKGHLFLNEVYDMVGIPRTKAGQCVGWVYDEKCPIGDNYVDFGLYEVFNLPPEQAERKKAFLNGYERSVILDFNVDGNILNML